jgi:RNA polymerase sigma-70 factor, ECF subfamily
VDARTDADVIAGSRDDPRQFAALYDRHAGILFRFLVRRVGRDTGDELLGETFRIAFERRGTFDLDRPNARPWLYGIATNLVGKHRRREARRLAATARLAVGERVGRAAGPADPFADRVDDRLDAHAAWPAVAQAVAELPAGERDALLLYAWEQLSYDEIAAALGIPTGTVRSRLHRARGRLRALAAASGEQPVRPDSVLGSETNDPWILAEERDRLMSAIDNTTPTPRAAWRPPAIYARLGYDDERAAIDFLTRAFGLRERVEARQEHEDGHVLAWLEHGDGVVMVGHIEHDIHGIHSPSESGVATCMLMLTVDDVDAHHDRAVAAGARVTMELNDAFYGERRYECLDPEDNRWHFGEPLASVRARRGEADAGGDG